MGPPPFGDGKLERHRRRGADPEASMGPPPFGDGKLPKKRKRRARQSQASMGPPPFGDGKDPGLSAALRTRLASMGPPPFGDGKWPWTRPGTAKSRSFNGATAFRRWKVPAHTDQALGDP